MKLGNLTTLIHNEVKSLAKTNDEAEISHYEFLLRDIIALSLSLRHQGSKDLIKAGNKMLLNLQRTLDEKSDLHKIIAEIHKDSGGNAAKDKEIVAHIAPHIEFNGLF